MKTVQTIYDASKKRRVIIFQRESGSFGFEEQSFSDDPLEMAWCPFGRAPRPNCHTDTLEQALVEVHNRITWISDKNS